MTPSNNTKQATILLVSDDTRQRRALSHDLQEAGWSQITPVASAKRALAAAQRTKPAVAILNACMTGTSCYELAEELAGVPVLFVTPEEGCGPEIQAAMVSGAGVLTYPCTPAELAAKVGEVVSLEARAKIPAGSVAARSDSYLRRHTWA